MSESGRASRLAALGGSLARGESERPPRPSRRSSDAAAEDRSVLALTQGNLERWMAERCPSPAPSRLADDSVRRSDEGDSDAGDAAHDARVAAEVAAFVDSLRGMKPYIDPCQPPPADCLSELSSPRRPSSAGAASGRGGGRGERPAPDPAVVLRRQAAARAADRAEISRRIRYATRDQLRQLYLDAHEELLACIEELLAADARAGDLDDRLARTERRADLAEEEVEVTRIHLAAADEHAEALMAERAEALRKLTESKSELARLSARHIKLQQRCNGEDRSAGDGSIHSDLRASSGSASASASASPLAADATIRALRAELAASRRQHSKEEEAGLDAAADSLRQREERIASLEARLVEQSEQLAAARAEAAELRAARSADVLSLNSAGSAGSGATPPAAAAALRQEAARARAELAAERETGRRRAEMEAKLLADVSHLARQLRSRERIERAVRRQRRDDAALSREELLEEVGQLRSILVEREASIAALQQKEGAEEAERDYTALTLPSAAGTFSGRLLTSSAADRYGAASPQGISSGVASQEPVATRGSARNDGRAASPLQQMRRDTLFAALDAAKRSRDRIDSPRAPAGGGGGGGSSTPRRRHGAPDRAPSPAPRHPPRTAGAAPTATNSPRRRRSSSVVVVYRPSTNAAGGEDRPLGACPPAVSSARADSARPLAPALSLSGASFSAGTTGVSETLRRSTGGGGQRAGAPRLQDDDVLTQRSHSGHFSPPHHSNTYDPGSSSGGVSPMAGQQQQQQSSAPRTPRGRATVPSSSTGAAAAPATAAAKRAVRRTNSPRTPLLGNAN